MSIALPTLHASAKTAVPSGAGILMSIDTGGGTRGFDEAAPSAFGPLLGAGLSTRFTLVGNNLDLAQNGATTGQVLQWTGAAWAPATLSGSGPSLGTATPLANGTASAGSAVAASHEDHRHPTDTTRAPLASPVFTGSITLPTWTTSTRPGSPIAGMEGFATDTSRRETYTGSAWVQYVRTGDIPAATSGLLGGSGTAGSAVTVTIGTGLSLSGNTLSATASSAPTAPVTVTSGATSGSPYAIPATNGVPIRMALATPAASYLTTPASPVDGQKFSVRDALGNSGTYAITITAANGSTIQGGANTTIAENGVEREWRYSATGTNWELIKDLPYATTINNLLDYVAGGGAVGVPVASQLLLLHPLPHPISLPAGLAGSVALSRVAATASTVLTIALNHAGTETAFATITFAAGAKVGTFAVTGSLPTPVAGDALVVTAPSSPDATLADIGISILGSKT